MNLPAAMLIAVGILTALPAGGEERLTLRQCVEIAMKNHPNLRAADGNVAAAEGRLLQSGSAYYPQVQASTGYSENHSLGAFGDSVTKMYATTIQANQVLYDFGRTGGNRDAAKAGRQSAEQERTRTIQEVVLNVKQAYYALLQSQRLLIVAQKTLDQSEVHLLQAEAFFRAGSKPRFDVTRAEVDVNSSRLGIITAQNRVRVSAITLNQAMGTEPGRTVTVEEREFQLVTMPSLSFTEAEALRNRPELLKAESDVEMTRSRVTAERSGYWPTLSANGSYTWANGTAEMGPFKGDVGDSWNAGITLTVPLFEGRVTEGRVSEAKANLLTAEAQRDVLRQAVLLEVNQAYADLESAAARVGVTESSLKTAQENLSLAQGRYRAGVGPSIEVTDAEVAALKAETDHVQAQYDYQLAVAKLEREMGAVTKD
ncbi:MAG: TolC family protein [Nitrospiraceae bacterium]|nr:TolC family protein [Nitrospiraceae bacterium]